MSRAADQSGEEPVDVDALYGAELDLAAVAEAMEVVEWSDVPTISTPEAAAWTARLQEAREACLETAREANR